MGLTSIICFGPKNARIRVTMGPKQVGFYKNVFVNDMNGKMNFSWIGPNVDTYILNEKNPVDSDESALCCDILYSGQFG